MTRRAVREPPLRVGKGRGGTSPLHTGAGPDWIAGHYSYVCFGFRCSDSGFRYGWRPLTLALSRGGERGVLVIVASDFDIRVSDLSL